MDRPPDAAAVAAGFGLPAARDGRPGSPAAVPCRDGPAPAGALAALPCPARNAGGAAAGRVCRAGCGLRPSAAAPPAGRDAACPVRRAVLRPAAGRLPCRDGRAAGLCALAHGKALRRGLDRAVRDMLRRRAAEGAGAAPAAAAISHRLCLHAALPPHGPRPVACADAPAESAWRAGRGRARLVDGGARHAA